MERMEIMKNTFLMENRKIYGALILSWGAYTSPREVTFSG